MNLRLLIILITISFVCTPLCALIAAADSPMNTRQTIAKRYEEAKFYYNQLQTNAKLSADRENWLKGTRNFRRIYLLSPKSKLAPACLFMLGRIYTDMFELFKKTEDIDESISYYKDIVRLFPRHKLADDSYFALGLIFLEQDSPERAAEFFTEIVTQYPKGDMLSKAEEQLKTLSKDYDIALPRAMISPDGENKLSYVLPVKYWSSDNYTRVVIVASNPVNYKEELLQETSNTPRRLYIDFKKSYIEPQYRAPVPIEDGLLKRIRTGQFSSDTVRVVLDIESIESYKIFSLPDPFRVVIDVRGKEPVETAQQDRAKTRTEVADDSKQENRAQEDVQEVAQLKQPKPGLIILNLQHKKAVNGSVSVSAKSSRLEEEVPDTTALSLAQQLGLGVKKIVIDPGHGGKDPGAMGFGMKEKDIVLSLARDLAPVLSQHLGCEVILTREEDVFIPLEERTAIANTENADLFISLHVNAHPSSEVHGLETYYLNLTTNAEAMRVAAMENETSTHQMSDLQEILSDIMRNSKREESARLAQHVHSSILKEAGRKGYSDIKNLGVKQAPFYVLIGAQMPAILLEIAFITNEEDAKKLGDREFLRLLVDEITNGISTYIHSTTASFQTEQTFLE
ncbi:MAG: hypothetical protein CSA21_07595 [Deltaproteobacteria bacterium]|nr:MAG: hypothetical protein CSA21_07595 [Deltaproteobacteria bacterium]